MISITKFGNSKLALLLNNVFLISSMLYCKQRIELLAIFSLEQRILNLKGGYSCLKPYMCAPYHQFIIDDSFYCFAIFRN